MCNSVGYLAILKSFESVLIEPLYSNPYPLVASVMHWAKKRKRFSDVLIKQILESGSLEKINSKFKDSKFKLYQ